MKIFYIIVSLISLTALIFSQELWALSWDYWLYYKYSNRFWWYLPALVLVVMFGLLSIQGGSIKETIGLRITAIIFLSLGGYTLAVIFWIIFAILAILLIMNAIIVFNGILAPFLWYLLLPEKWGDILPIRTLGMRISANFWKASPFE